MESLFTIFQIELMPLKRSLSGPLRPEEDKEAKKELFFDVYEKFLGSSSKEYSAMFRSLQDPASGKGWEQMFLLGFGGSYYRANRLKIEAKILFECYCLLRALEEGKNILQPMEVHKGGGLSKEELVLFLHDRRFYNVISTSKSEFVPYTAKLNAGGKFMGYEFLKNMLFTLKIQPGISAIDALNCRFPNAHVGAAIADKIRFGDDIKKAMEYKTPAIKKEVEVTLPPGVLENVSCLIYRKNKSQSPFTPPHQITLINMVKIKKLSGQVWYPFANLSGVLARDYCFIRR